MYLLQFYISKDTFFGVLQNLKLLKGISKNNKTVQFVVNSNSKLHNDMFVILLQLKGGACNFMTASTKKCDCKPLFLEQKR